MADSTLSLFPSLGPWGLPVTPALSLILTLFLDDFVTPDHFIGIPLKKHDSSDEAAAKHAKQVERAERAAKNLRQTMPLLIFSTCVALSSGVRPESQNIRYILWLTCRVLYKWACIKNIRILTGFLLITSYTAVYLNLINGFILTICNAWRAHRQIPP
ncbi:uncharacterized protein BKA78DRAFT_86984 [Phyllosticta capitalensis]|uniref:uncharacterized protein n=1 Tax=Phyllosticta capitalensis TaxID=121624 RepID=UPI00312EAD3F